MLVFVFYAVLKKVFSMGVVRNCFTVEHNQEITKKYCNICIRINLQDCVSFLYQNGRTSRNNFELESTFFSKSLMWKILKEFTNAKKAGCKAVFRIIQSLILILGFSKF